MINKYNDKMIHIVCTIDNNYLQHCIVMLSSLIENNKTNKFTVHLVINNIHKNNLNRALSFFHDCNIEYKLYDINPHISLQGISVKKTDHVSIVAYFRILLPLILPESLSKILYLDPDMIITADIRELWDIDISNVAFAAIEERNFDYIKRLNMPKNSIYFNSGVLLINLNYWRNNNVTNRILSYISNNQDKLICWDQDALNAVLYNEWKKVDAKWNTYNTFFFQSIDTLCSEYRFTIDEITKIRKEYVIIHYTGGGEISKPWYAKCQHPLKDEYWKYIKLTPWKHAKPIRISLLKKIERKLYKLFFN